MNKLTEHELFRRRMKMDKLTEHELLKRLDNEFDDVDFQVVESATKGVVATVQFYENKIEENEDDSQDM